MNKREAKYRLQFYNFIHKTNHEDYLSIDSYDRSAIDAMDYKLIVIWFYYKDPKQDKLSQQQIATLYGITPGVARGIHQRYHRNKSTLQLT